MQLRRICVLIATFGCMLVLASPASAHHLIVDPPGGGKATEHWVGGPPDLAPLPANANGQGLHETPFGTLLPAAHSAGPNDDKGLVQACKSAERSGVVSFVPPPSFFPGGPPDTDCMHGEPPPP